MDAVLAHLAAAGVAIEEGPVARTGALGPIRSVYLERVRRICLALPEATERLSHGEPTFFVRGKVFVMFANNHHGDGRVAVWLPAPPGFQEGLIETAPADAFRALIEPALLVRWWPPEAALDAREGGAYCLRWPQQDWRLRGHFLVFAPPERLEFTWRWDHEPELPERTVRIVMEQHAADRDRPLDETL